jgi:hypothetical protein
MDFGTAKKYTLCYRAHGSCYVHVPNRFQGRVGISWPTKLGRIQWRAVPMRKNGHVSYRKFMSYMTYQQTGKPVLTRHLKGLSSDFAVNC